MWNSKFFTVMIVLTTLAVATAVTFQFLEMRDYNLVETLIERFSK